jgi:hypothetical protein
MVNECVDILGCDTGMGEWSPAFQWNVLLKFSSLSGPRGNAQE